MKLYTFHLNDGSNILVRGVFSYDEDNFYVTEQNRKRTVFPKISVLYWTEDLQR